MVYKLYYNYNITSNVYIKYIRRKSQYNYPVIMTQAKVDDITVALDKQSQHKQQQ